jgi:hypothetical protein
LFLTQRALDILPKPGIFVALTDTVNFPFYTVLHCAGSPGRGNPNTFSVMKQHNHFQTNLPASCLSGLRFLTPPPYYCCY